MVYSIPGRVKYSGTHRATLFVTIPLEGNMVQKKSSASQESKSSTASSKKGSSSKSGSSMSGKKSSAKSSGSKSR